jgi:hypothetical protein
MPVLPHNVGISDLDETRIQNQWDTIGTVLARLATRGITIPTNPPPFPIPEVSTTLVDTDNQEYLKTNARYLAWLNYIMPHISLNEAVILQVDNELANIEHMYRDSARKNDEGLPPKSRQTKEEINTNIALDPRYVELTQQRQELAQECKLLEDKKEELSRVLRVISRHIEVKKLDADANRLNGSMPRRVFNPHREE